MRPQYIQIHIAVTIKTKTTMSGGIHRAISRQLWAGLLSVSLSVPALVHAATDHAAIMPLASHSLLLDIAHAGPRIITVGERGHILYSDDQGSSWTQALVPTTQMLTAVHFANAQRGWAVGHDGLILVSDDGGKNWRVQRDGITAQHQTNLQDREQAHQLIEQLQLELAKADDDQRPSLEVALEDANMDLEDADLALTEAVFTSPLMDIWFRDTRQGWAVGAFGTLLATVNGGKSWEDHAQRVENPDEFHLNAITGDDQGRIVIAGEGGVIFRSLDNGKNWQAMEPFYAGSWFGLLYNLSDQILLVYGLRGNLYRSTDFANSWEPLGIDNHATLAGGSLSASGDIALVGSAGTVLESRDGGRSFSTSLLADRLSLSSAVFSGKQLIMVGQGGIRVRSNDQ